MDIRNLREAMRLAHEREELIQEALIERQLAWCLIPMRQSMLSLPVKIANHFGARDVPIGEVVAYTQRSVQEILKDLARLPAKTKKPTCFGHFEAAAATLGLSPNSNSNSTR